MISSATALVYFKSIGHPLLLYNLEGVPNKAAWGVTDAEAARWFGAHGFRVDWAKGPAVITEGRGALQRYIRTWIEIGAVERVEIIDDSYKLTHGLIWADLHAWERAKLEKIQSNLDRGDTE